MDREQGARRTVRCGLHGRFYDAWSAGCPDCARGGSASRSRLGAGFAVALLLVAGGLALAYWQGGLPLANTTRVEPTPVEKTRVEPAPAPLQPDLEALERFAETLVPILADGRGEPLPIGWELRVYNACANPPAAPAPDDARGVAAHQLLGDACHELRAAILPPADSAAETWRQQALDQAAAKLAAARAELAARL